MCLKPQSCLWIRKGPPGRRNHQDGRSDSLVIFNNILSIACSRSMVLDRVEYLYILLALYGWLMNNIVISIKRDNGVIGKQFFKKYIQSIG